MHLDRRALLSGIAASLAAAPARASAPVCVGSLVDRMGTAQVVAFDLDGRLLFASPLPARGHDMAVSPDRRWVVVLARRPGRFAVVLDAGTGALRHTIVPPDGRSFQGHGVFTPDGRWLLTAEIDLATGTGRIGIHDANAGYIRVDERETSGIGPHDAVLLADGRTLAVAHGGLGADPLTGRDLTDRKVIRSDLTFLDLETGTVQVRHDLTGPLASLSLRHLALAAQGRVLFGCQWEGDRGETVPLIGYASPDKPIRFLDLPDTVLARLAGYVGSVACDPRSGIVAATSPRGGLVVRVGADGAVLGLSILADACAVDAAGPSGCFVVASGQGRLQHLSGADGARAMEVIGARGGWDNHLRAL
jgi:hypothetical protein